MSRNGHKVPDSKVAIGIPVFNGAHFLAESLDSLLSQSYEDIDFLISDNGSTDGTEEICRAYAARDARVRYFRSDVNQGASWNYKNAVHQTSAPFFKWATHDDLLAPTYIERCLEVFDEAPATVALVYPRTKIIDDEGVVVREYDDNLDIRDHRPHRRLALLVQNIVMANASFGLIRRTALDRSRLLDAFPTADYVMMAELAMVGEFWEIPEFLFFRREHAAMSRKANPTAAEAAEWFAPGSGTHRPSREFLTLFIEHFRSIHNAPLGHLERTLCYGAYLPAALRRYRKRIRPEITAAISHAFSRHALRRTPI
jgi:glycosyltransferase involved in cell wall biosynthesis